MRLSAAESESSESADVEMNYDSEYIDINIKDGTDQKLDPIKVNTLIAALTLTGEGSEEWILARVKSFDGKSYVVEDAEVEEESSIEIAQKEYDKSMKAHMS